jgi:hypothetical protein
MPGHTLPSIEEHFSEQHSTLASNPTEHAVEALPTVDAAGFDDPDARVGCL